ncbi:MAG: DoxX family protein, partial [Actinobacteria bacterium]|nr:DoxX family protein [Actinomycetota bacterium]
LILPGLLGIRPSLTPLAAAGLVIITIGATVYQLAAGQVMSALFAVVVGLLSAFVAYGRWRLAKVSYLEDLDGNTLSGIQEPRS